MRTLTIALAAALTASSPHANAQTIDFLVDQSPRTQLLNQLVDLAGLSCALDEDGPYTLFAPTDNGFDILPEKQIADLRAPDNRELLREVLTYHLLDGDYSTTAIAAALERNGGEPVTVPTVMGDSLTIAFGDERYFVSDALGNSLVLSEPGEDLEADNGTVHFVVGVLMPSEKSVFEDAIRDCAE